MRYMSYLTYDTTNHCYLSYLSYFMQRTSACVRLGGVVVAARCVKPRLFRF